MQFVNHTPFPALKYAGIDPLEQQFHVIAMRQTMTWNSRGALRYADTQLPLCDADEYLIDESHGHVRQESDLCVYKPRCDVIVNAAAHVPKGHISHSQQSFDVRVRVLRPESLMASTLERLQRPAKEIDLLFGTDLGMNSPAGTSASSIGETVPLLDKAITVNGVRSFMQQIHTNAGQEQARLVNVVAGLGSRPRANPDRARLLGNIDDSFLSSKAWLPADFDFAVFNSAWPDQQLETLVGNEVIELVNLCTHDTLGAQVDHNSDTVLQLMLPNSLPFCLIRYETGAIGESPMKLDTVFKGGRCGGILRRYQERHGQRRSQTSHGIKLVSYWRQSGHTRRRSVHSQLGQLSWHLHHARGTQFFDL